MSKNLPTRKEDYSKWYKELIGCADLNKHFDFKECTLMKNKVYDFCKNVKDGL